jgi:fatty acid desaturase
MVYVIEPKINWYRTPINKVLLHQLMKRSNWRGGLQTAAHLGLFFATGAFAYYLFSLVSTGNLWWSLPCLIIALFVHGTIGPFMGLIAIHELQHRTVFANRELNAFFEKVYAFISWSDYLWYQRSHTQHHLSACHGAYDGEVVLPVKFSLRRSGVWLGLFAWNPLVTWGKLRQVWEHAQGRLSGAWYQHVLPESDTALRAQHKHWAQFLLLGHGALALLFVTTGHWFLIVVFTIGTQYCSWLGFLCGVAQHYGLRPDVPDFRYNTRTFTCSKLTGFYYWNMQYHLEHHMYPAVPFYNLPNLRAALIQDLPVATQGLRATWRQILAIKSAAVDTNYQFTPVVPAAHKPGRLPIATRPLTT